MQVFLGTKEQDGSTVSIQEHDRRKHCAIWGKSGVGKTTLIRNSVIADLYANNGVTVIDPHGSLIEDLLEMIPRHRTNDVIYINPAHPSRIIGLNVLESVKAGERSLVVSSLISILRNLWPLNWGPRTEYILEHAVYALLEQPQPVTLAAYRNFWLTTIIASTLSHKSLIRPFNLFFVFMKCKMIVCEKNQSRRC